MRRTACILTVLLAMVILLAAGGVASAEEVITPELIFYVNNGGSMDMVSHPYAVIPADLNAPAGFTADTSFTAVVDNGYRFLERDQAGTGPVWSVTQISGEQVSFTTTESNFADEGRPYISVTLDATPQTAQDIVFQITCDWGDYATQTGTRSFTMEFLDVELPSLDMTTKIIEMQVGVEQPFTLDFDPPLDWDDGKTRCDLFFSHDGFFASNGYGFITSWENTLTPVKAGNVAARMRLYYANLALEKLVLFHIADETGNFPEPIPETVPLDRDHFPDSGFRAYVANTWDRNRDGGLDAAEIIDARWVDLLSEEAMSLEGIEYLSYVQNIFIDNTPVSSLDLTANTRLESFSAVQAGLTELNVTGLTGLKSIYCRGNALRELDVRTNVNLQELYVSDAAFSTIDLSGNPLLTVLDLSGCQRLTGLDLSGNPALERLYCSNCQLTELDLSHNTALRTFVCDYSHLTSLDLSGCTEPLESFSCEGNTYTVLSPVRIEDLPGSFDPQKVSDLTGAELSADGQLTLTEPYATYTYDCGNGASASFRLNQRYPGPGLSCEADQLLVGETAAVRVEDGRTESFSFFIENEAGETFYPNYYRDWSREEEEGVWYYRMPVEDWGPSGTVLLKVCAWLEDDIRTDDSVLSLAYVNNGQLEMLSSDLPEIHDLGQPLTVTLGNLAEGSRLEFALKLMNADGSASYFSGTSDGNVINYPAENFAETGRYVFTAVQKKAGWVDSPAYEKEFTVEGTVPPAPEVTVNSQELLIHSQLVFTIRAEGMTSFRYRATEDGDIYVYDNPWVHNGETSYSTEVGEVGDRDYSFSVLVNGIWSEWSAPLHIHVYSLGVVEIPEPEISETYLAGEPISIGIPATQTETVYALDIASAEETPYFFRYFHDLKAGEHLLMPFGLDAGTYEVHLFGSALHYESGESLAFRIAVEGTRPRQPELQIPEYTVGEIVPIRLTAENMDAAAMMSEWGNEYDLYYAENGTVTIPYLAVASRVIFRARVNGLWSEKTETVCLPSWEEFYGEIQGPELTMPDRIALGEDLTVQVGPVPGAGWYAYNVSWYNPELEEYTDLIYEKYIGAGSGTVTIPSAELSMPGEYRITVNVYLADEYCSYLCATTEELTVYADGQSDPAPVVSLAQGSWPLSTDIPFQVQQAGADTLRVMIFDVEEYGDYLWLARTMDFPADGVYRLQMDVSGTFRAVFATRTNGRWSETSTPILFTVDSPEGELPGFTIQAPEETVIGENLTVTWTPVEEAESWEVFLYRYDCTIDSFRTVLESGASGFTFDTGSIPGLAGGGYHVEVTARAAGHEAIWENVYIKLLDPAIRPSVSQVSAGDGQAVIRVSGIASERLRLRINGKDAGYLQADPGQTSRNYRLSMESDPMTVSVANYGSNPTTWSDWSSEVSVSSEMGTPDLSEYSLKLKLNTTELSLNGRFIMTASVTDSNGDPVSGVKVGFRVVDSEWNDVDFYGTGDSFMWETTPDSGKITLAETYTADGRRILKPMSYRAVVFFVDDDSIYDMKGFEFRLDSLHLPASLNTIEAEAFANLDCQAVFIPEGCTSIGERAFADCSQLYYVRIPSDVTEVAENAFEGCPDSIWIDRE